MFKKIIILSFLVIFLFSIKVAGAVDVLLEWSPVNASALQGYKVYVRLAGDVYNYDYPVLTISDPNVNIGWVVGLDFFSAYAFVVRAFNVLDVESEDSNEVGPVFMNELCEILPPGEGPIPPGKVKKLYLRDTNLCE